MTPSEELVHKLCLRSFLSPWSFANPLNPKGKELCDVLIVCAPNVIVFSIKEIALGKPGEPLEPHHVDRWRRKAIEASVAQLDGACRALTGMTHVLRADGKVGLALPPAETRRVHRIAVALGSKGECPLFTGGEESEISHVFDELALEHVMQELDTVADFTDYLRAKEALLSAGTAIVMEGGEHNLLAAYLNAGRKFPQDATTLLATDGLWATFTAKPEVTRRKQADTVSLMWDELIEKLVEEGGLTFPFSSAPSDTEAIVRVMAREPRFARRMLGGSFFDGLQRKEAMARVVPSGVDPSVNYVFFYAPRAWDREQRIQDLLLRCIALRGLQPERHTVIGIGTEVYDPAGYSLDGVLFHEPEWTAEWAARARGIREDFGWFKNIRASRLVADEYPTRG